MKYLSGKIVVSLTLLLLTDSNATNLIDTLTENLFPLNNLRTKVAAFEDFVWKQIENNRDESYSFILNEVMQYHDQFIFNHIIVFSQNFPPNLFSQLDFFHEWIFFKNQSVALSDIFDDFCYALVSTRDECIENYEEYIQNIVADIIPKVKLYDIYLELSIDSLGSGISEFYRRMKSVIEHKNYFTEF